MKRLQMKIHHLGYLVSSIPEFESHLVYERKVKQVFDPIQKADLALYETGEGPFIELIEPKAQDAFTFQSLQKNGSGFHHLCYQLPDQSTLEEAVDRYLWIPIKKPMPAVLFGGDFVSFYMDRNRQIVEILIDG